VDCVIASFKIKLLAEGRPKTKNGFEGSDAVGVAQGGKDAAVGAA
jgi:hypothetical protein